MRITLSRILILLFALAILSCRAGDRAIGDYDVVKVVDGDTIHIRDSERQLVKLRLYGIDTPEKGQPFYRKAREALATLVAGENVAVHILEVDDYGRMVGKVYLRDDGTYVNLEMVRQGWAWWYQYFAPDETDLRRAEAEARDASLGLWRDRNPVPPWDWRRRNR